MILGRFDPDSHRYTLQGELLPSVTQIIPKQFLPSDPATLEAARIEGIRRHELSVAVIQDDFFGVDVQSEDRRFVEAFRAFIAENRHLLGAYLFSERPLYSKRLKFAGTPDHVFENGILECKRTLQHPRVHSLQGAGYSILLRENKVHEKKCRNWFGVEVGADSVRFRPIYNPQAEGMFLDLLQRYRIDQTFENYMAVP